jgi:hypothetical protein
MDWALIGDSAQLHQNGSNVVLSCDKLTTLWQGVMKEGGWNRTELDL